MQTIKDQPYLWNHDSDRLKIELESNNKTLNRIQKVLSEYLETKREAFNRFYFLSDEDLLDILSHSRDIQAIQRHMNKCFESINRLGVINQKEESFEIESMFSGENEQVMFQNSIIVDANISLEEWMIKLESQMKQTLKYNMI
jgi:dynein heavy chain